MEQIPINTDKYGNCSCIKAAYYKMGVANFLKHQNDGFKATCIMEVNAITVQDRVYDCNDVIAETRAATRHQCHSGLNDREPKVLTEPLLIPEATTKGYAEAYDGDSVNLALPNSKTRRGRVGHQQANTLDTSCNQGVVTNYRIRKLTPRECFRLMDVSETDIDKLLNAGISNSQLYKLAGNSIVVSCLYHIFRKMFIEPQNENQQLTLF